MPTDGYDEIITDDGVVIGHISGSERVLFIKTGQGGSIYGESDKYLNLAREINERYGMSIFVSATDCDSECIYQSEMELVKQKVKIEDYDMYYLGVSKGGLIGIWYAKGTPVLRNILTVNAPLMINFYSKSLPAIKTLGDKLTMIYGDLDPSFKYLPFIEKHTRVETLNGADHNLCGSPKSIREVALEWLEKSLSSGDLADSDK